MISLRLRAPSFASALVVGLLSVFAACATAPEQTAATEEASSDQPEDVVERPAPDFSQPPEGFSAAEVLGVGATPEGAVVLLGSKAREAVLPIFIGPSQALTIDLRMKGQDFQRPLTHDLLEDVMGRLGGAIGKVHVDGLRDGTFVATIFLITPEDVVEVDARPSDAIALAVGEDIPIYVDDEVLADGGLTEEELRQMRPEPDDTPGEPTTPL